MKKTIITLLVLLLAVSAVFAAELHANIPSTLLEQFSYVVGYVTSDYYYFYKYYYYPEMDDTFAAAGYYDYYSQTPLYTEEKMQEIISDYVADYNARMEVLAVENLEKAESFLEENAKQEGIYTTESGLQYKVISQGTGEQPTDEDTVELDYELKLLDGTVVDSSYERGEHSSFAMTGVISGFAEGCKLMPLGSHYVFYIHPDLGYGTANMGNIGPNALLIFEVETYSIVE
jgi:FKBP-type peptidyl-prolyl cis-trans isomerase